jgi:hypothetical protein
MTLNELYRDMRTALQGSVDAAAIDRLTTEASRYAGTVGWAEGVIDKDGRIAVESLREMARSRFEKTRDSDIATLHDALADLLLAIRTHDEDLDPSHDNVDHDS